MVKTGSPSSNLLVTGNQVKLVHHFHSHLPYLDRQAIHIGKMLNNHWQNRAWLLQGNGINPAKKHYIMVSSAGR